MVETHAYMQKLTNSTVSKNSHNKIPVGRLGGITPHNFFGRGGDRPHRCHGVGAYGGDIHGYASLQT